MLEYIIHYNVFYTIIYSAIIYLRYNIFLEEGLYEDESYTQFF